MLPLLLNLSLSLYVFVNYTNKKKYLLKCVLKWQSDINELDLDFI